MYTTKNPAEQEDAQVHEAMTAEELAQAAEPNATEQTTDTATSKRPNACKSSSPHTTTPPQLTAPVTELMSAAKKPKPDATSTSPAKETKEKANPIFGRDGLWIYIDHPEKNPEGRVVEYDDDFVVIRDKFPKARYAQPFPLYKSCKHRRTNPKLTTPACTSSSSPERKTTNAPTP
jgi:aprataxin